MSDATIDPHAVLAALGAPEATVIAPVSGGWDTMIWRVERGGEQYALRLFRTEQVATARREVLAMRAAVDAGLPAPRIHAEGVWADRPALLLSWCAGQPLIDVARRQPWRIWALGVAFGRMQARIHAVPPPAPLRERNDAWIAWAGPDQAVLQAHLRTLPAREATLLHLDYHPLNVLVEGTAVTAVLDWANALAGDRRADLARTLTILRLAPTPPTAPPVLVALLRRALERGWRQGYREVAGPQPHMGLFYAWAGAVIVRDLTPKVGRPGVSLTPRDLQAMRHWALTWQRRAGVTP